MILDIMMPGKDGFETLSEIRQFSKLSVIILTVVVFTIALMWIV